MRAAILAVTLGLCVGACRPIEPPVLEIARPALAELGGERAICDAFVSGVATRNRPALLALLDSLPRTPGVDRDAEKGINYFFSILDGFSIPNDIVAIRSIGRGVVERTSLYYYEVEFLRLIEAYISTFTCELEFEVGRGGKFGLNINTPIRKDTPAPRSEARAP